MSDLLWPWLETVHRRPAGRRASGSAGCATPRPRANGPWRSAGVTMACALGMWADFLIARPAADVLETILGWDFLVVEELNGPLHRPDGVPLLAHHLRDLADEDAAVLLRLDAGLRGDPAGDPRLPQPWGIIALLALGTVPLYFELRARRQADARLRPAHGPVRRPAGAGLGAGRAGGPRPAAGWVALLPLLARSSFARGIAPFHCWMTDLFEHAIVRHRAALRHAMVGAYVAVRLVLPIAPDWVLAQHRRGVAVHRPVCRRHGPGAARGAALLLLRLSEPSALVLVGVDTITSIRELGEQTP